MRESVFSPKLVSLVKGGISKKQVGRDIVAGLIVGVVALPLAIAFAIASGVSPDKGLITAIVAGITISALGGSRVQIGGPTGAFIVIVYAIVGQHGIGGLTIATFMAGIIMIAMGFARLGSLLKYIPYPLIVGFTSGIAVIIFSSQVKDFFGMSIPQVPADFIGKWKLYTEHFGEINWYAVALALATVLIVLYFSKVTSKIPGSIVAIVLGTLAVYWFKLPVTTIETTFGEIPNHFSMPAFPKLDLDTVRLLIQPAITIALLGGIESLLSAVVADGMIGGQHRSNTELVAQGAANIFSSLFGGIPATGAIARTATNVRNGGRTPIAGITHAITLLVIMILLAPFAKLIPMACLAGILVVVAYHMSEWRQFKSLLKGNKWDVLVLLVTFFLTIIFDLVIAIEVGVVLSSFALMKRMSESMKIENAVELFPNASGEAEKLFEDELPRLPKGVSIFEISGALFFGAAQTFQDTLMNMQENPRVLILRMRNVPFIDSTGIYRLTEIIKRFNARGVTVILSGVNPQVKSDLIKADIYAVLDESNLLSDIDSSIKRASAILN